MKIYFEDDMLCNVDFPPDAGRVVPIDAHSGVTRCLYSIEQCYKKNQSIYTNQILALHNQYAWNDELEVPEVYIRHGTLGSWTRIDKLTERELRQGHNIMKLYLAGAFE